jgi:arabinose-5-phosphate isomerase
MKEESTEISLHTSRLLEARKILNEFVATMNAVDVDDSFSDVVEQLLECKGKIVTTGIGKAGHAMKKFSSLLCSLSFPSCFMHPGEASHGDLGIIGEEDILFVASTSGKTREVLEVIELARNINVKTIIGITSHKDSPIREKADFIVDMGAIVEAGHLRMAPTCSILVMLALTDALALVASREKGLTKEEYGKCHHGGYLGAKARGDNEIH